MIRKLAVIIGGIVVTSASSELNAAPGTEGNTFLSIPIGAGPAAMGSAYSAWATDAYAPVWNPAGLAFANGVHVAAQHLSYVDSIRYEQASLAYANQSPHAWGASIQYLTTGDIPQTNGSGATIGDFSASYSAYLLSYAYRFSERLSVGTTGRYIGARLADVSAGSYSGDLGVLWQWSPALRAAATINHVGSQVRFLSESDPQPTNVHVALAYDHSSWKASVEAVHTRAGSTSGRIGAEITCWRHLLLRGGYRTDTLEENSPLAGLTTGFGLRAGPFEFAYAWLPLGDLGFTQYFSVTGRFGKASSETYAYKAERERQREKTVQRPTKQKRSNNAYVDEDMELMYLLDQDQPVRKKSRSTQ